MIGVVHPGAMGAALGADLVRSGHVVGWASTGRSGATAARARAAGLTDLGTPDRLGAECEYLFSVCPPGSAIDVANDLAGYRGTYIDANAVSPATAEQVCTIVQAGGARYVDGGIIGTPPASIGQTRLYLSGPDAPSVAALFTAGWFTAIVLDETTTAASRLKMSYAAYTKMSSALLLAVRDTAISLGVWDALQSEWAISQPALGERVSQADAAATSKGWRWVAEMNEIADTFASAGTPREFGDASAHVFSNFPRPPQD